MFTLSDMMFVNADTLASLQIIQTENHPNSHMQGPNKSTSGAKEGLSLYGLFCHLACTPQGKQKLRQLFLRPSTDLAVIEERLNSVSVMLRPENSPALEEISRCLKKVKDIRTVVIHLRKGISDVGKGKSVRRNIWANIRNFTFQLLKILEGIHELSGSSTLLVTSRILTYIHPVRIREIGQMITEVVDFERSVEQHRTAVLQGVDVELDGIKQTYDGMGDLLTRVATQLSSDLPEWARQYVENCIFFPQLGFLTVVPLDPNTGKGKYEGEGIENDVWERMFASNDMGYYKNQQMKDMDSYFGDMYGMICGKPYAPTFAWLLTSAFYRQRN
jgi:DNA mismatch repair protein MSH5